MDPARFTTIAHGPHRYCNPVDPAALEEMIRQVGLRPGDSVVDVGCGKAELLALLAERHGASCFGVDLNGAFLAEGRALADQRGVAGLVTLIEGDAARLDVEPASCALALCIGASHALGGYPQTLRALGRMVRPGGHVLVGEGYWKRTPDTEYLERLGATADEMGSHEQNLAAAGAAGLEVRDACTSREEDWDRYEDLYADAVERYVATHPEDPDSAAMQDRIRRWQETYRRWGRSTMGFGLYLFRRP